MLSNMALAWCVLYLDFPCQSLVCIWFCLPDCFCDNLKIMIQTILYAASLDPCKTILKQELYHSVVEVLSQNPKQGFLILSEISPRFMGIFNFLILSKFLNNVVWVVASKSYTLFWLIHLKQEREFQLNFEHNFLQ